MGVCCSVLLRSRTRLSTDARCLKSSCRPDDHDHADDDAEDDHDHAAAADDDDDDNNDDNDDDKDDNADN